MNLRRWFLAPAWCVLAVLFFAPMAIIVAYSLLTRGAYGGVTNQWTTENYVRLADLLYGVILLRTLTLSIDRHRAVSSARISACSFYREIGKTKESLPAAGNGSVLDQLPRPDLRMDVPVTRHRAD